MSSRDRDRVRESDRLRDSDRDRRDRDRGSKYNCDDGLKKILVTNLNTKNVTHREMRDLFGKHGKIIDMVINETEISVTFDKVEDAKRAVEKENNLKFQDSKIEVRLAPDRSRPARRSPPPYNKSSSGSRVLPYDRNPREMSPYSRSGGRERSPRDRGTRGGPPSGGGGYRGGEGDSWRGEGGREDYPLSQRGPPPHPHSDGYGGPSARDSPSFRGAQPPASAVEPSPIPRPDKTAPYDAAVIAMDHSLVPFCESLERRLQVAAPLITHIIALREEAHVAPCVEDLTRKGVLYAVIVTRMNQQHGSCTLRLLHGSPQEHRNMPVDDAMTLIARNFDSYLVSQRERKSEEQSRDFSRMPPGFIPPPDRLVYLFNLLADYRMLTMPELEEVGCFLRARIDKLYDVENAGTGAPPAKRPYLDTTPSAVANKLQQPGQPSQQLPAQQPPPAQTRQPAPPMSRPAPLQAAPPVEMPASAERDEKAILAHQAQLQAKILSILNPSAGGGAQSAIPGLGSDSKRPGGIGAPIVDNRTIQKALDTLFQSGAGARGDQVTMDTPKQSPQVPSDGYPSNQQQKPQSFPSGFNSQQQQPNRYNQPNASQQPPPNRFGGQAQQQSHYGNQQQSQPSQQPTASQHQDEYNSRPVKPMMPGGYGGPRPAPPSQQHQQGYYGGGGQGQQQSNSGGIAVQGYKQPPPPQNNPYSQQQNPQLHGFGGPPRMRPPQQSGMVRPRFM